MIDPQLFLEILTEHQRQREKHGPQNYPNGTGSDELWALAERIKALVGAKDDLGHVSWAEVFAEEACEVLCERDPANLRKELVQVATVALAWASRLMPASRIRAQEARLEIIAQMNAELGRAAGAKIAVAQMPEQCNDSIARRNGGPTKQ